MLSSLLRLISNLPRCLADLIAYLRELVMAWKRGSVCVKASIGIFMSILVLI